MPEIINLDVRNKTANKHNTNRPQIHDHPYRTLTIGDSGTVKTNSLFNLMGYQPDIDKNYLYANNSYDAKYQLLINICKIKSILMILKLSLNIRMIWMIFVKVLKNIIQIKNKNKKH